MADCYSMTDFSAEHWPAELDAQSRSARLYFADSPDLSSYDAADVDDVKKAVSDWFGYGVNTEPKWGSTPVYTVDCLPDELTLLSGLVEEMGFWPLLRSQRRTTVSRLINSGINILPAEYAPKTSG